MRSNKIIINGKEYSSISKAAKELGIEKKLLIFRIDKYGINSPQILKNGREILYAGQVFPSIKAMAKYYGMNTETLRRRIKRFGLKSPKLLSKRNIRSRNYINFYYRGHLFKSMREMSKYYNIPLQTLYRKIQEYGLDSPKVVSK